MWRGQFSGVAVFSPSVDLCRLHRRHDSNWSNSSAVPPASARR